MIKECKLIVSKTRTLVVSPLEDAGIEWSNVSEAFRKSFEKFYLYAQDDLIEDSSANYGLNCLSILERIGTMINQNVVDKETSFNTLWMNATDNLLKELEIA